MADKIAASCELSTSAGRLEEENRELKALTEFLASNQIAVEQRLERVENSVVFRFLRWLGPRLISLSLPDERNAPAQADRRYALWLNETAPQRAREASVSASIPESAQTQLISIVLHASRPDRSRMERALTSLNMQHYANWELFVCCDEKPPDWFQETVDDSQSGRTVEIVTGSEPGQSFEMALNRCRGEFLTIVSADAILEPGALNEWRAAAESDTIALHSDWDFISPAGRRHTPRFTPECSPELLSQTLYWGVCYMARTEAVRRLTWRSAQPALPPEHRLAVALANGGGVLRIPKILWHMQDGAADPASRRDLVAPVTNREAPASIVVCSRNARLLDKCLKSLRPTLGAGDEVIVVAHQEGNPRALGNVASSHGARLVPYRGTFHFGLMNRLGVEASANPLICLLNDDVTPVAKDWLPRLSAQALRPEVGVAGALLLYPNGTIEHAGMVVGDRHTPAHAGRFQRESPYWPWLRATREVTAVTGACMALRRTVWDELNGFDTRFPVNFNDVDLCLRAGQRGYKVVLEARAVLTHEGCGTRTPVMPRAERQLFYTLWSTVLNAPDRFFNPHFENSMESIVLGKTLPS